MLCGEKLDIQMVVFKLFIFGSLRLITINDIIYQVYTHLS